MFERRWSAWLLAPALWIAVATGSWAQDPAGESLHCTVEGDGVALSWNIQFFAPIRGWIISRDGKAVAKLEPGASAWAEKGVPAGEHLYELAAVNFDGTIGTVGRCSVVVGDFGMKCAVVGGDVHLAWGPILIDVLIRRFIVRRDGRILATLPPDVLEYVDRAVPAGKHRYTVRAETSPGHEFLIGACTVRIVRPGFVCTVLRNGHVLIDWSGVPLPRCADARCAFDFFRVARDGEIIAELPPDQFRYEDDPGPGAHHYVVTAGFAVIVPLAEAPVVIPPPGPPEYLIGECKVIVPGGQVPPPEELTCLDLDAPPEANLVDYLTRDDVLLVWQKPVEYDRVLIARNGELIATLPGSQFWYVDRNLRAGVYTYAVSGVLRGHVSLPAICRVAVPHEPLPPPTDLTCRYIGPIPVPGDPPPDAAAGDILPIGAVSMSWRNGAPYEWVVIVRDGEKIARIPGGSTSYVDRGPPPGLHTYGVFGVVKHFRTDAALCRVRVPPAFVPPPQDLRCLLLCPVPGPEPAAVVEAELDAAGNNGAGAPGDVVVDPGPIPIPTCGVLLRWRNPVPYDRILIARNGMQIAALPGSAESYTDRLPSVGGIVRYEVRGVIESRRSLPATCEVEVGPPFVPPPQDFRCVVAPWLDPADPTTAADAEPVVGDDGLVAIPVPVVRLSWVNPVRYRQLILLRDGAPLAELPGDAMRYNDVGVAPGVHVYTLWGVGLNGAESAKVRCRVEVGPVIVPPVRDLTCLAITTSPDARAAAVLSWRNAARYDAIVISRDASEIVELPGTATRYVDRGLAPGVYRYAVRAVIGARSSRPVECRVVIPGVPPHNLLFFSSGLFEADPATGDAQPVPDSGDGTVMCLASNADPIQGWSFGVCSDPTVLEVAEATIDGTETAELNEGSGPTFLALTEHDSGVTMAAVVDQEDPEDVLPAGEAHRILHIAYEPGPDALPGSTHRISYCDGLGEPPVAVLFVVKGFEVTPGRLPGWVRLPMPTRPAILRGDSNGDNEVDMSDAITTLKWLFLGGEEPGCLEAADANGSRVVNIADPIYTLQFKFAGGPPPPAPYPECGVVPWHIGCKEPSCPDVVPVP